MRKRRRTSAWTGIFRRSMTAVARSTIKVGTQALKQSLKRAALKSPPPTGPGAWSQSLVTGAAGARRFRLYQPPDIKTGERLPLLVMLHGCGQDANAFATSTRMNRVAMRERFLVLYPEQDRLANGQGCWNWFDTASGRAYREAGLIIQAVDQVCLLHPVDSSRLAIAGLSAGASMAALVVSLHPTCFKAVVMHSGIPPGTAHSTLSAVGAMRGRRTTSPLAATPLTMAAAWPALLVIHGEADGVVSPQNGQAAVQSWAYAAGARAGTTRSVQRGKRYPMSVTDFKRRDRTVATLVLVSRLAHAWSGGAANKPYSDERGPDASRMVWSFIAKHFNA
ncbi:phospholipase [Dechloromonas denitrificans]|uniref:Phospholipase n=1 Tax=Dechloromonas denitrificans TaxID=281362 RepID=A0A133XLZ9_9RHOO|nr:PHB depolymerase family esterase [Dechloromonas denitrificans]KXB31954.1 phospholipase [Dechloromonas denitrificans]